MRKSFLNSEACHLPIKCRDIVILEHQDQVIKLTKQIAQVKEAMKEPSCFEGSLNPNRYLKWVQTFAACFEAKGYANEERLIIAIEKLQGLSYSWFRNLKRESALQGRPKMKTLEGLSPLWI